MLKRLELVGFKSFADKTDFDLPHGISAIVGPNGSGKSNIVDAIRWVLGEQSARSLRGGEMTDVIFNGSATRKPSAFAEVSLIFDNSRKVFNSDLAELQVTRRVMRSGESEYLINLQTCRLKDIRDLFLGSGAGSDAYCIIEQGKVDGLLQSSPKDRRAIFDEAAGISRFKVKKLEALRRLERVDQNVERLKDILEEVERQLKAVRLQAAKALKWQEYSNRLKDLRLALGLREYTQLSENLLAEEEKLLSLRTDLEKGLNEAGELENQVRAEEKQLQALEGELRQAELAVSSVLQRIASCESTLRADREALIATQGSISQSQGNCLGHRKRLKHLDEQLATLEMEAGEAASLMQQTQGQVKELEAAEAEASAEENGLRILQAQRKDMHLESMRLQARLQNAITGCRAKLESFHRESERLRQRNEQAVGTLAVLDSELGELSMADEVLQIRLSAGKTTLGDLLKEKETLEETRDRKISELAGLQAKKSGILSRLEVLQGLERNLEGFGSGLRQVLEEKKTPGPWDCVLGVAVDYLDVPREFADLIDLAMGEKVSLLLVQGLENLQLALAQTPGGISSRVSFLDLQHHAHMLPAAPPELPQDISGILGWAFEFVRPLQNQAEWLPRGLLGNTLLVESAEDAKQVMRRVPSVRCITRAGEILESDGILTVGQHHAGTGLLSRKAELRDLEKAIEEVNTQVPALEESIQLSRQEITQSDRRIETQRRELDVLSEQAADLRANVERQRQRKNGLDEELQQSGKEIRNLDEEAEKEHNELATHQLQAEEAERHVRDLEAQVKHGEDALGRLENERRRRTGETSAANILLAQARTRAEAADLNLINTRQERKSRLEELEQGLDQLGQYQSRATSLELALLRTGNDLAHLHLEKEKSQSLVTLHSRNKEQLQINLGAIKARAHSESSAWRNRQELVHGRELAYNDLLLRRTSLEDRLREDYQIELASIFEASKAQPTNGETVVEIQLDGTVVSEEIAELRKKIQRLGNVNVESIEELSGLESRHGGLKIQYDDLVAAKKSLEEIIAKINADSKALFVETFQNVRLHFQDLFRKLFGGGMADILLEDDQDVLECGIEIKARPPGKELRSISLMSGGEKTMTAVALLLAIFRNKPSPFCLLDEVDAALDEANINRFTGVLREFLDVSQFILITHSKRTMSCADVLYGITMQESGVSRRMAIRFQDWKSDEKQKGEPAA